MDSPDTWEGQQPDCCNRSKEEKSKKNPAITDVVISAVQYAEHHQRSQESMDALLEFIDGKPVKGRKFLEDGTRVAKRKFYRAIDHLSR